MAENPDFRRLVSAYANDGHRRLDQLVESARECYSALEKAAAASPLELVAEAAKDFKYGPAIRNLFIQAYICRDKEVSAREICGKLDNDLAWGATTVGLPAAWIQKYAIQTFEDAYDHEKLKGCVEVMITRARSKVIRIAGVRLVSSSRR